MKQVLKGAALIAAAVLAVVPASESLAQEHRVFQGDSSRWPVPNRATGTPPGRPIHHWLDAGRGYLRWWSPVLGGEVSLDNEQLINNPGAIGGQTNPTGTWQTPTSIGADTLAFNYFWNTTDEYRLTRTVGQTLNSTDPRAGATATYNWTFTNLVPNNEYELHLNIPIGPTSSATPPGASDFPQRYYVVEVTGQTNPHIDVIDAFVNGGDLVRLGDDGEPTSVLFSPTGTTLTITLYNTAPRDDNGSYLDPGAAPGAEWVYADSASIVESTTNEGEYIASPVVGRLSNNPPAAAGPWNAVTAWRVNSARNEVVTSTSFPPFDIGILSSFLYKGDIADLGEASRLNRAWSWPAKKQIDSSAAESTRFSNELEAWLNGPAPGNERHTFRSLQDNTAAGSFLSGAGFALSTSAAHAAYLGPNYAISPVVPGVVNTGAAQFRANLPDGSYSVQVWMPDADSGATLATNVTYQIVQGGTVVDTITFNQSTADGWTTLPGQPAGGYLHGSVVGDLEVVVLNNSASPADAGRQVFADAVRFTAPADLSITSTPAMVLVDIDDGSSVEPRDVVFVATEDGRIQAVDAHGDYTTGVSPQVYWTYPSDNPVTDPNSAPAEDGGVAELPTGFDLSSAAVEGNRLYIAANNGRVYCLDATGRGDGTTSRIWTFPDDYDPSDPTGVRAAPFAPIKGSVAIDVDNNQLIIPTTEGRIYAVDLTGSAATKSTSLNWVYPPMIDPALGEIRTTPVYAEDRVFFNAPSAPALAFEEVFALDAASGTLDWRTSLTTAGVFAPFGNAGPTFVSAAQIRPPGPFANDDTIIVCDLVGRVASIEADTGALNWQSVEVASGASAAPTFVFLEAYRTTSGTPQQNVPCVLIPSNAGSIVGVMINGQTNSIGERRVYQYNMTGGPASPIAVGGWRPSDTYCWFYAGDASGQFFAFNGDDPSFITPGRVPGTRDFTEDDPGSSDLSNIFSSNRILLVSPESHKDLATKLRDGTLTRADLLDAAANESIARRIFDFGETLYILAYDLPAARGPGAPGQGVGGPPTPDYRAEVVITIGGRQIRRQVPVNDIPTMPPGANSRFVLTGQPLLPTGRRGLRPGLATVALRARAVGNVSVSSALVPLGPVATNGEIRIANPLALFFNEVGHVPASGAWNSVGDSTDATLPINLVNGSPGIDAGGQAGPNKESTNVVLPGAYFGPNFNLNGDDVAHGSTGGLRVTVRDRSLMFMVLNRGLQNVKLESDDYSWQVRNISNGTITDRNMWKPLSANTGASYPGFEDLPTLEPNLSIDYPDIDGSRLSAAKSSFGRVQNPIFSGVGLNMPLVTAADKTTYFTRAGFEVQMIRTLQSTFFDLTVDVPRYQPASGPTYAPSASRPGYRGHAQVYVEAGSTGFSAGQDTYRTFANAIRIGADERLSIGTPTVDLGSMPSGAGFDGGPPAGLPGVRGPIAPWDPTSSFRPYNSAHDNMFDDFVVYNEGNVNLLNVRVAKAFDRTTGLGINRIFRPVELLAPSLHDLSWLDGPLHMFSSLDPLYSNTGRASQDPEARNILQKPRPGDAAPTRLSTNPVRRPNVNLGVTGGTLLNAVTYPPGDPRIGVSTPLGAPSGEFLRRIWVFEDSLGSNGATPETPSLGPRQTGGALDPNDTEAYSDPPMNLKFTVREARMTNRPTTKAAPNVDTLVVGNEDHYWQNRQPTALRTGAGSMLTAFASNRLNAANLPGFGARTKLEADEANLDTWRIYLTGLGGSVPNSSVGQSPIRDLNNFIAGSASRWQTPLAIVPAAGSPLSLFSVPNHTMVPGSADFHSPSFAAAGSHDPLSGGTGTRPSQSTRYLAYLGEAEAVDGQGTRKSVSQIMISNVDLSTGAIGGEFGVPYDEFGFKSRPSITQQGGLATVMYTTYTSAAGQINWTTFNGSGFTTPRSLPMGRAFDWVGAPSTVLRRYRNSDAEGSLETTFAARRRGRSLSETMMARLATGADGLPIAVPGQTWDSEFGAMRPFGPRIDELQLDTTTGAYWAPGMMWRLSPSDLDFVASPTSIQILDGSGTNMIAPATAQVSADGRTISGMTPFGGTVSLDTITGSVRFDGAVIPRSARIFVRYAPFYISVMSGGSSNTRSASSAFDDRLLGIYVHPTDSQRTKLTDLSYWARESGAPAQPTDPIRWDRTFVASTRTSNDGSQSARPSFKTLRFGVQLPTPIAVDAAGIAQLSINWTSGIGGSDLVPAFERFYQVDPANGRVYLMSGAEDRLINITYTQADTTGAVVGGSVTRQERVVLVEETAERTVPIEQATNESDLRIFLDPSSIDFNGPSVETRRPGLVWLFWTSTRSGGSDVYFQTLAPRFSVIPPG